MASAVAALVLRSPYRAPQDEVGERTSPGAPDVSTTSLTQACAHKSQTAPSFGVNVRRIRLETMLVVSLLAAVPVSFVGTIGFVGLVGPHIARMILGEDQRFFLPGSIISGALLLSLTSIVSKSIIPGVVFPIGIISALVGVPFFFSLILSNRSRSW
ncbi:FecCD family ABC transporter permease [Rhizobium croatiense]|uniref:FecCD family ABC transporter permease n=1 Tax=Rhizobium croatiense TaxID=2867516 RepID=UPI00289FBC11|nr:iron ABC transporter permease [Rhizobium croatiense]